MQLGDRLRERNAGTNGNDKDGRDEKCYLFPSLRYASACQDYLRQYSPPIRTVDEAEIRVECCELTIPSSPPEGKQGMILFMAYFPPDLARLAKSFWQHPGLGISSRMAEYYLSILALEANQHNLRGGERSWGSLLGRDDIRPFHALPRAEADEAKRIITDRIAQLAGAKSEADVVLFPSGMSAIWHVHLAIVECFPGSKSVCFGYVL